jgi:single-strand DNA-binding protein
MKNSVNLIGHIGQDAQVKTFESGKAVINFSIATSQSWTTPDGEAKEETTWHNCDYWTSEGKTGLSDHLTTGKLVDVSGTIRHGSYPKAVGKKTIDIPTTTIVVDNLLFLSKKAAS